MNFSDLYFRIKQAIKHRIREKNPNSVHSPFVFDLYFHCILPEKFYHDFDDLEKLRRELLGNQTIIEVKDFGAGQNRNAKRKISETAAKSLSSPKKIQLIFKLVDYFKPKKILELGTSLGLSTLYMQRAAASDASICTLEGCPSTLSIAMKNFRTFEAENIQSFAGNIDDILGKILPKNAVWDFIFLDANHRKNAVLRYFDEILPYTNEKTVIIIDDIYWSADMLAAWQNIIADERVKLSIDLFHFGIILFRDKQPKQDFLLNCGF